MQNSSQSGRQQQAEMGAGTEARETVRREMRSAGEVMHDARDEVAGKAREYASEAKSAAMQQAETAQKDVGAGLVAFGGALRAAGDHLDGSNQAAVSQIVRQAADGIEHIADSLKNRPFADTIEDVRNFGRENSGLLFAGSLLAGLALGRLVKSGAPTANKQSSQQSSRAREAGSEDARSRSATDTHRDFPEGPVGERDFPSASSPGGRGSSNGSSGYE